MSLVENKKARFDYEKLERFEAGIELLGTETKAVKMGRGTLEGSRVIVRGGEAFLVGANIPAYQPANAPSGYDPERTRRLLLKKAEIKRLGGLESQKGLTLIPISLYNKGNRVKVDVALVRHLKKHDKREKLKKRDAEREIRRTLKDEKY